MPARLENEMEITNVINNILKDMPSYVVEWHNNLYASKRTAATRREFIRKIRNFLESIDVKVSRVTPKMITDVAVTNYYISIATKLNADGSISETSDSYQQNVYCVLKNFLGFMERKGYIDKNYILDIQKPGNRDLDRINEHRIRFTKEDFANVINSIEEEENPICRNRDRAIMKIFMGTGMRETALRILDVSDIDLEKKTLVTVDKGAGKGKLQQYYLNDATVDALKKWLACRKEYVYGKDNGALFLSYQGNRISTKGIAKLVDKHCYKALGKHVSPHKIRGGVASILYDETKDIEFVRRSIGHSNVATTQRYIRTENNERQQAAKLLEF